MDFLDEIDELRQKLKASEDIRHAEKQLLLQEIAQNAVYKKALELIADPEVLSISNTAREIAVEALQKKVKMNGIFPEE